jgi:hypothetical protein
MRALRSVSVLAACVVVIGGTALAGTSATSPRFSFSTSVAKPGDDVSVRLSRRPRPFKRPLRLYLVPEMAAAKVLSRFDSRLTYIGSVAPKREAARFAVSALEPGLYALAYWCRGCVFSRGKQLAVQLAPLLRVAGPDSTSACPVTTPNGRTLPGIQASDAFHGNGTLGLFMPRDGVFRTPNADGTLFEKMIWAGAGPSGRELVVRYELLDSSERPLNAETIAGQLGGYSGPSWASRMQFTVGCWKVTGRVDDVSLALVIQVVAA